MTLSVSELDTRLCNAGNDLRRACEREDLDHARRVQGRIDDLLEQRTEAGRR